MRKTITSALVFSSLLFILSSAYAAFFSVSRGETYTPAKTVTREPCLPLGDGGADININTASVSVLGNIPYVGNRADEIVKIRSELGGFVSIEQIALVKGIGLKNFLRIKPYIRAD
jgi:competence ComEA-like helix-hairpin-helix protein